MTVERVVASESAAFPCTSTGATTARTAWLNSYISRLAITDATAIVVSVGLAQLVRFGSVPAKVSSQWSAYSYGVISVILMISWIVGLALSRTRDPRVMGTGAEEYARITRASFALFGSVAIAAYLLKLEVARGYLAVALPLGMFTLVLSRWLWRRWLVRQRARGRFSTKVVVVGSHRAAIAMANLFERDPSAGYQVVGVCVPGWRDPQGTFEVHGHAVPVLGNEEDVSTALQTTGADMVAVSNTEFLGAEGMRALAWHLEALDVDLVVSSGVVDVAGPRLQIRPVAGLPLLHVDKPAYRGANKISKMLIDLAGASLCLILLSPLLLVVAMAIKLTSRGPVFYRSERIGLNGEPFAMMKFRSMAMGAESRRLELVQDNEGAGPLFKIRNDPRVTRVGRWMRRLSIDELPQLVNVLRGQMSVVGPRPPLRAEVLTYSYDTHRRLLVKPGLTGLWQVSGRSNLTWEESVRMDLYYVENWSTMQDLRIVWRTLGAVIKADGAY